MLIAALFRVPFPDGQARFFMRGIAEAAVSLSVAWAVWHYIDECLGLFVVLTIFSWLYVFSLYRPPVAATFQRIAYFSRDYVLFGAIATLLFMFASRYGHNKKLMDALAIIAGANFVFIVMQHFSLDPYRFFTAGIVTSKATEPIGLMTNKNETSALFALCFWACRDRPWLGAVCLAGIALSASTGGVAALACGAAVYGLYLKKPWQWKVIVAVAFVGIVAASDSSGLGKSATERIALWSLADAPITKSPVLGYGIGSWPLVTRQLTAHNDFLQLWLEVGIFGPLLLFGYLATTIPRINDHNLFAVCAIATVAANAMISFPMQTPGLALIAALWVGVLANDSKKRSANWLTQRK